MNPALIIIGGELQEDLAQVRLTEYNQMVDALPPDRADQSLDKPILPRRARRDRLIANAHGAQTSGDNRTVNGITVADQVVRLSLSETQIRTYWWCSPPGIGSGSKRPTLLTSREIGTSFCKDRCVRASL
jgi:hypothetical protein